MWFWILILINVIGFFVYKFSSIADGAMKEPDKAIGLILVLFSYVAVFFRFGIISFLFLLVIIPIVVAPILILTINTLEDRFFPERIKRRNLLRMSREKYQKLMKIDD